jgi:hypothetical protein
VISCRFVFLGLALLVDPDVIVGPFSFFLQDGIRIASFMDGFFGFCQGLPHLRGILFRDSAIPGGW